MNKTTVYLPDDLKRALERMAKRARKSEAELIREAIARHVQGADAPAPRLPLFRAKGEPIAERIDDELEGFGVA